MTRVFESNGPEVKIRGTASHVAEKYLQLARDAQGSGDPVSAENFYQHAEHYFRIIAAAQEQFRQSQPLYRNDGSEIRDDMNDGDDGDEGFQPYGEPYSPQPAFQPQREQPPYQRNDRNERNEQQNGYQHNNNRQHHQPQPQPQQTGSDTGNIDRLPSFITGSQPQPDINGNASNGGNGNGYQQERGDRGDRFNHRRRRRPQHGGPRSDNPNQAPNGDFADNAGE